MRCIKSEPGHTTVSIDLSAGEPTVTAHFSQDPNYRYATFEGVGKRPFYKNGVLMIDDLYLQTMSVSPIGREKIYKAYHSQDFNGKSFVDQWVTDAEVIKKWFKADRDLHKMLCLALGYGMGPKKMVKQCYDKGYSMPLGVAQDFYRAYWDLYAGVRKLADRLGMSIKQRGYIVNPFGYRLTPPPHKAFNFFIQSSVSGIMHVFNAKLFSIADYAKYITVIHDEVLADTPDDKIELFRNHKDMATQSLNEDLKWTTSIRTGFAIGKDWYEAK